MRTLDPADFVRAHTRSTATALVPEIRLRLSDEPMELWEATQLATGDDETALPYWAFAWAGGQALARYVLDHPAQVRGHHVLDVASGCGIVAIAAALAGASAVTALDIDPYAIAAATLNADANRVTIAAAQGDAFDGDGAGATVVLAGDVCYQRAMTDRALAMLERARARGARIRIGDPGRAYLPRERFASLATYQVPVSRALEATAREPTAVLRPAW